MTSDITAATRLLALLGDPVRHSLSPVFQNAAIRAAGQDAVYVALRCETDDVRGLIQGIARAGGGGNVTVPHKETAALAVQSPTPAVVQTGVCNTFWMEGGVVRGDNTDVVGFGRAAEALLESDLAGARVLVLGAGGAARAVVFALLAARAERIVVANRSPHRSRELADRFDDAARIETRAPADVQPADFDLVVNATSLGLRPDDPFPLPPDPAIRAALDLVYAPARTPWIRALRDRGVRADDGLEMLLHQGAAAFERWFAVPAPLEAMREALPARTLPPATPRSATPPHGPPVDRR